MIQYVVSVAVMLFALALVCSSWKRAGKKEGVEEGRRQGYKVGFGDGEMDGYRKGYNACRSMYGQAQKGGD